MSQEGKIITWAILVVFVISMVVSVTVFQVLNDKVTELEVMKLDSDDWTEVCYETKTVNRSKIINPAEDCGPLCLNDYYCWDIGFGLIACDEKRLSGVSCIECLNATEPYIYSWQEQECARKMLVQDMIDYGDIIQEGDYNTVIQYVQ